MNKVNLRLSIFAVVDPTRIVLRIHDREEYLTVFLGRSPHAIEESPGEDHVHVAEEQKRVGRVGVGTDLETETWRRREGGGEVGKWDFKIRN